MATVPFDPVTGRARRPRPGGPNPRAAYYALLPLAVPLDIITLPILWVWAQSAFPDPARDRR